MTFLARWSGLLDDPALIEAAVEGGVIEAIIPLAVLRRESDLPLLFRAYEEDPKLALEAMARFPHPKVLAFLEAHFDEAWRPRFARELSWAYLDAVNAQLGDAAAGLLERCLLPDEEDPFDLPIYRFLLIGRFEPARTKLAIRILEEKRRSTREMVALVADQDPDRLAEFLMEELPSLAHRMAFGEIYDPKGRSFDEALRFLESHRPDEFPSLLTTSLAEADSLVFHRLAEVAKRHQPRGSIPVLLNRIETDPWPEVWATARDILHSYEEPGLTAHADRKFAERVDAWLRDHPDRTEELERLLSGP